MVAPKKRDSKGNYWSEKEDALMQVYYFTGSTALQKAQAMNQLYPILRMMGRVILERYFSRYGDWDLIDDAVCNFIRRCKYDPTRGSYYSYIGTSLKYYFNEKLVVQYATSKRIEIDDNYEVSENEWLQDKHQEDCNFDDFDYKDRQVKLNAILVKFRDHIKNTERKIEGYRSPSKKPHVIRLTNEKEYLLAVVEYFEKFFLESEVSMEALNDYLIYEKNINSSTCSHYSGKYFGIDYNQVYRDNRKQKRDNKYKDRGMTWIMDDYTPDMTAIMRAKRTHALKKGRSDPEFEYF